VLGHPSDLVELGAASWTARDDGCRVLADLTGELDRSGGVPMFAYSLPQNLHITYVQGHPILDEPHPGFYAPLAARLRQLDVCFGAFIQDLKARGLYDNSVIILTSDHGDSLGEGGRWGHGFAGFPEIFRVPLIMHMPPRLAAQWSADADAVSFTTDIVPTLYRLLGQEVTLRGPIVGMPLFYPRGAPLPTDRRRGAFLLAASYGPVYGLLQRNGELLYVVDAVNSRDYAYNLSGGVLHDARMPITAAERMANQQMIREQIEQIAAFFHFNAQPSP
jgi:membrane-anchored protein YejM (alkaline phosphatase superfamily)